MIPFIQMMIILSLVNISLIQSKSGKNYLNKISNISINLLINFKYKGSLVQNLQSTIVQLSNMMFII